MGPGRQVGYLFYLFNFLQHLIEQNIIIQKSFLFLKEINIHKTIKNYYFSIKEFKNKLN